MQFQYVVVPFDEEDPGVFAITSTSCVSVCVCVNQTKITADNKSAALAAARARFLARKKNRS